MNEITHKSRLRALPLLSYGSFFFVQMFLRDCYHVSFFIQSMTRSDTEKRKKTQLKPSEIESKLHHS
jgi:hypothetical protein